MAEPHTCQHCQKAVLDLDSPRTKDPKHPLRSWRDEKGFGGEYYPDGVLGGEHSINLVLDITPTDMLAGASNGCLLFSWLLASYEASGGEKRDGSNFPSAGFDNFIGNFIKDPNNDRLMARLRFPAVRKGDIWELDFAFINVNHATVTAQIPVPGVLDVMATPDDPVSPYISTRPVERCPASEEQIRTISSWIKKCNDQHKGCAAAANKSKWIPSRLLKWESTGLHPDTVVVRLEETAPGTVEYAYATLSYCWGGDQALKCLGSTIHRLKQGVTLQEFPKTIRDALIVCRNLQVPYLWVDALCIMQDDSADLAVEIDNMPSIYGGSKFTILAAQALTADSGYRQPRTANQWEPETYRLPHVPNGGPPGSVILSRRKAGRILEPIDTRAWIFQEQMLTVRCLQFSSAQTSWRCMESMEESGYTDGWRAVTVERVSSPMSSNFQFVHMARLLHGLRRKSFNDETAKIYFEWRSMLSIYSSRLLTVSADRILAISGVAERFGQAVQDEYLAGLWKGDLVNQLMWGVNTVFGNNNNNLHHRPAEYQGPSWSWVSVSSGVDFPPITRPGFFRSIEGDGIALPNSATLSDYSIQLLSSQAKFGSVVSPAWLEIKTRTAAGKMTHSVDEPDTNLVEIRTTPLPGKQVSTTFSMRPDTLDDKMSVSGTPSGYREVLVVEILSCVVYGPLEDSWQCCGLVLEKADGKKDVPGLSYRRLGTFHHFEGGIPLPFDGEGMDNPQAMTPSRRAQVAQLRKAADKFTGQEELKARII